AGRTGAAGVREQHAAAGRAEGAGQRRPGRRPGAGAGAAGPPSGDGGGGTAAVRWRGSDRIRMGMTTTRLGFLSRGLLAALVGGWVLGPGPRAAPGQVVRPPEKPGAPVDLAAEPEAEAVVEPVPEQQAVAPAEGAGDVVIGAAPVAGTFYP